MNYPTATVKQAQEQLVAGKFPEQFFRPSVQFIVDNQLPSGEIPWYKGGHTDPWDHIESAMGLSIGGEIVAAEKAYHWLKVTQLIDGSWWATYRDGKMSNPIHRDSNFIAYVATGVWHHFLITQDKNFLQRMWPVVDRAIAFVLSLQAASGEIKWAINLFGKTENEGLYAGCCSIYKSLGCASEIAQVLGHTREHWRVARQKLLDALHSRPALFNSNQAQQKSYSMYWFYPVLTGVLKGEQAREHINNYWSCYVVDQLGCLCLIGEPWVTIAESCELTMALLAAGERDKAVTLFGWLHQWRDKQGVYENGYQMQEKCFWPEEKTTWTSAGVLLAADALTDHTGASDLFKNHLAREKI